MACASAASAVSTGMQVRQAGSRASTSSVSLKPSFGQVRCLPRALSLNDSVKKVQMFGARQGAYDVVRRFQPIWAQAVDNELASKEPSGSTTSQKTTYYYLIANAKFMLDDEEHFQEQMQEKLRMYGERNKEQDFWMVIEPEFLDKHPEVAKKVGRPAAALVSTDKVWIQFMKLRLDRVLRGEMTVDFPKEALAGKLTTVKFEKPAEWIAPYPKYEGEWWTPFLYKENLINPYYYSVDFALWSLRIRLTNVDLKDYQLRVGVSGLFMGPVILEPREEGEKGECRYQGKGRGGVGASLRGVSFQLILFNNKDTKLTSKSYSWLDNSAIS